MPPKEEIDASALWKALGESSRPIVGWALTSVGAMALILGYLGASREVLVARQLPYLASGGLAGIALIFLGAIFIGTQDVRRYGERLERLEQMLTDLHEVLLEVESAQAVTGEPIQYPSHRSPVHAGQTAATGGPGHVAPPGQGPAASPPVTGGAEAAMPHAETTEIPSVNGDAGPLVALPSGTTFHRPDCSTVTGKAGVQPLADNEAASRSLKPCKLCQPDHAVV